MKSKFVNNFDGIEDEFFYDKFDEPVTFRLVNLRPDPEQPGKYLLPRSKNIPSLSQVLFKPEKGQPKTITIGYVVGESAEGSVKLGYDIEFGLINNGQITLNPKNSRDVLKFNYMNYCSFNKDSKWRSGDTPAVFERVHPDKEAKNKRDLRKLKLTALNYAQQMTDDEVMSKIEIFKRNVSKIEIARDVIETYAEGAPAEFLRMVGYENDKPTVEEMIALAKKAYDLQVIENNTKDRIFAYRHSGDVILTYSHFPHAYKEFGAYLVENPSEVEKIKTLIKGVS